MTDSDQPYVDPQSLTDTDTYLYEAIATLEYTGRPVTRDEIAAAVDLDDATLDQALASLTDRGLLTQAGSGQQLAFEPSGRGWSAAPDQAQGM
jgi:hypothetical protein